MKRILLVIVAVMLCRSVFCQGKGPGGQRLCFVENKGQVTDQYGQARRDIDYAVHGGGLNIFAGRGSLHYQWAAPGSDKKAACRSRESIPAIARSTPINMYRMDVTLRGANKNAIATAEAKQDYYENYYLPACGEQGAQACTYGRITYKDIYPGIDWVIYEKGGRLEYEFRVKAGGNPADIQIEYEGATSLTLGADGSLKAGTPMGTVSEHAPVSYLAGGAPVSSSFALDRKILHFNTGPYSPGKELIIDPALDWATYYVLISGDESGGDIVCAKENGIPYVYKCGQTSQALNVATVGAYQTSYSSGSSDAVLAKFDSAGHRLWATYYGGEGYDCGFSLACDGLHNIYMSGMTTSSTGIATPGSQQPNIGQTAVQNAFLVKFNSAGARKWATYYGAQGEWGNGVCVDAAGYVYMTGFTGSSYNISTPGSYKQVHSGNNASADAFLVKFDSLGVREWGTYYGSTGEDRANAVRADSMGGIYITGRTASSDSIATAGAYQPVFAGVYDAFLAKFNAAGALLWATYYGGISEEEGQSIACKGNYVYMSGYTGSTTNITTPGSYQPVFGGGTFDDFVVQFNSTGQRQWATYYGGPGEESISLVDKAAICLDDSGNVFLTSGTTSNSGIATPASYQQYISGNEMEVYLAKLSSDGATRKWGTYYGGCGRDEVWACATDGYGYIYLGGFTNSLSGIATPGSFEPIPDTTGWGNAAKDEFIAKFRDVPAPGITGDTANCAGATTIYSIPPVTGAISYEWILPAGWTGSSATDSINATAGANSGVVKVVVMKECSNDTFFLHVTIYPAPNPVITQNGNILGTTSYLSYQWYRNGTAVTGATAQHYTATQNGSYYVIVTAGCSGVSDTVVISNLSVANMQGSNGVDIYPNPVRSGGPLMISAVSGTRATLTIYDVSGRKVYGEQLLFAKRIAEVRTGLQPGIYIAEVINENYGTTRSKLVVTE